MCRLEQYRVKTIIYRSLLYYANALERVLKQDESTEKDPSALVDYSSSQESGRGSTTPVPKPPQHNKDDLAERLRILVRLFDEVLREEYAVRHKSLSLVNEEPASANTTPTKRLRFAQASDRPERKDAERRPSCNFMCDFCGADIFQSFFECRACRASELGGSNTGAELQAGDGLLLCPGCYVEGRSCQCEEMTPMQCRPFDSLLQDRNHAAKLVAQVISPGKRQPGKRQHIEHLDEK